MALGKSVTLGNPYGLHSATAELLAFSSLGRRRKAGSPTLFALIPTLLYSGLETRGWLCPCSAYTQHSQQSSSLVCIHFLGLFVYLCMIWMHWLMSSGKIRDGVLSLRALNILLGKCLSNGNHLERHLLNNNNNNIYIFNIYLFKYTYIQSSALSFFC